MIAAKARCTVRGGVVELQPRVRILLVPLRREVGDVQDRILHAHGRRGYARLVQIVGLAVHEAERRLVDQPVPNAGVLRLGRGGGVGLHERRDVRRIEAAVAPMPANLVVVVVGHRPFLVR